MSRLPSYAPGWYSTLGGKVAHYFAPWSANEFFLVPACGNSIIGARLPDHLRKIPARRCKRCAQAIASNLCG